MRLKHSLIPILTFTTVATLCIRVLAYSDGITGRTASSRLAGCSCHSDKASEQTQVVLSSSASRILPGKTYLFSVTVANPHLSFGGVNISARLGVLTSTGLRSIARQLTQPAATVLPATWTFEYTAPTAPGVDTIFATGIAVTGSGRPNGLDEWSFAKPMVVRIERDSRQSAESAVIGTITPRADKYYDIMGRGLAEAGRALKPLGGSRALVLR